MAIQISGTTVIDNFKYLINIGGKSAHKAGSLNRSVGTTYTYFRIGNLNDGWARLVVSCKSVGSTEIWYGIYDVFGIISSSTTTYNFKEVSKLDTPYASKTTISKSGTFCQITAQAAAGQQQATNITWDFYYNVGQGGTTPTITII